MKKDRKRHRDTQTKRQREDCKFFPKKRFLDFHLYGGACVLKRLHMGV